MNKYINQEEIKKRKNHFFIEQYLTNKILIIIAIISETKKKWFNRDLKFKRTFFLLFQTYELKIYLILLLMN